MVEQDISGNSLSEARPPKLLDLVRDLMRLKHYAFRTEQSYTGWIRRFILFHGKRHPKEMGRPEIEEFLTDLAVRKNVAKSTQNQAFNALIFLYYKVLKLPLEGQIDAVRPVRNPRLPVVMEIRGQASFLSLS